MKRCCFSPERHVLSHTLNRLCSLTHPLDGFVEERNNRSINKAVHLVDESLFDHLVAGDKHHPRAAFPQAEHWTVLLSKLHPKEPITFQGRELLTKTFVFFEFVNSLLEVLKKMRLHKH